MTHNNSQMRTAAPPLLPIFRSQLQGELLALVLLGQDQMTVSDLARRLGAPFATVAREVNRLEGAGLLRSRRVGRARQIAVDDDNPAVRPLRELCDDRVWPSTGSRGRVLAGSPACQSC